jgi:hypothetical protein
MKPRANTQKNPGAAAHPAAAPFAGVRHPVVDPLAKQPFRDVVRRRKRLHPGVALCGKLLRVVAGRLSEWPHRAVVPVARKSLCTVVPHAKLRRTDADPLAKPLRLAVVPLARPLRLSADARSGSALHIAVQSLAGALRRVIVPHRNVLNRAVVPPAKGPRL